MARKTLMMTVILAATWTCLSCCCAVRNEARQAPASREAATQPAAPQQSPNQQAVGQVAANLAAQANVDAKAVGVENAPRQGSDQQGTTNFNLEYAAIGGAGGLFLWMLFSTVNNVIETRQRQREMEQIIGIVRILIYSTRLPVTSAESTQRTRRVET